MIKYIYIYLPNLQKQKKRHSEQNSTNILRGTEIERQVEEWRSVGVRGVQLVGKQCTQRLSLNAGIVVNVVNVNSGKQF